MGRAIIKLTDPADNQDYYLEWSTIVDAPVTWGMSLEELREYYKEEYGRTGLETLNEAQLNRLGHNWRGCYNKTGVQYIEGYNRAGKNETKFSAEQIIEWYCRRKENPQEEGINMRIDEDEDS